APPRDAFGAARAGLEGRDPRIRFVWSFEGKTRAAFTCLCQKAWAGNSSRGARGPPVSPGHERPSNVRGALPCFRAAPRPFWVLRPAACIDKPPGRGIKDSDRGHAGPFSARKTGGVMQKALRAIVILGVLGVLEAVVFVPVFATAQAVKPTNKVACCFLENGAPTCGQLTADNCAKHNGTSLGAISCAHNPCLSSSTTTSTTGAATTTTSSAAPTTTTSSAAPTTTTSSAAATTTTCSAPTTTTTSSAAATTTTSSAAPTTTTTSAAATTTTSSAAATTTTSSAAPTTTTSSAAPTTTT